MVEVLDWMTVSLPAHSEWVQQIVGYDRQEWGGVDLWTQDAIPVINQSEKNI